MGAYFLDFTDVKKRDGTERNGMEGTTLGFLCGSMVTWETNLM